MDLSSLLSRLQNVKKSGNGWIARCPAHDDRVPSLSLFWGRDGRLHAHCHIGCKLSEILAATGLENVEIVSKKIQHIPQDPVPVENVHDLHEKCKRNLACSLGELYLRKRRIPSDFSERYGLGYCPADEGFRWSPRGRVTFPHTTPTGKLVNLYGRSVEFTEEVPRKYRHDHLPGDKAIFNAPAIARARETGEALYVCEGPVDALAIMASGRPNAVAIFGVYGFRWRWFVGVHRVVLALDNDQAGHDAMMRVLPEAREAADIVEKAPAVLYGGCKDLGDAWTRGVMG